MADYTESGDVAEPEGDSDESICEEARERFKYVADCDRDNRKNAADDVKFVYVKGAQWPDDITALRTKEHRPFLEINQLPQFVNQVVNDQRQQRPGIRVHPASGEASVETADIIQGKIRHIEYKSNAEAVYDTGFLYSVVGGRGYWRICTDYVEADTFDQDIKIERIPDPAAVWLDPDYQDPDGGDREYGFVGEWMTKEDFLAKWPKHDALSWGNGDGDRNVGEWYEGGKILVADYYRRVCKKRTLVAMSDGAVGWKDTLPKDLPPGITILRERVSEDYEVEWYKLAGGEQVLERIPWNGKIIPVICCMGDEIMSEGKRIYQGLIRRARDPQTMYNFWQTAATELIALAPKSPWVAAEGQLEGYENDWRDSNTRTVPVLQYVPISNGGVQVPPPQRTAFAGVPAGIVEQANVCKADLRATIGMYDPSLGQRSNEVSGRAIIARERQGDNATFHFVDNLSRAISLTGRIILELIPSIYDAPRLLATIGKDDKHDLVPVNQPSVQMNNTTGAFEAIKLNDLSVGKYSVTVSAGPSYETRRQEVADSQMQFIQHYPPAAQVGGDLIAKAMDWPDADIWAERLQAALPPQIQQMIKAKEQKQDGPQQNPMQDPQVQQVIGNMQKQLQQAAQMVQQLQSGVVEKLKGKELELQADKQVRAMDIEASKEKAAMELQAKEDIKFAELTVQERIAAQERASRERIAAENNRAKIGATEIQAQAGLAEALLMPVPPELATATPEANQEMPQ